jgi:hypothetical protein
MSAGSNTPLPREASGRGGVAAIQPGGAAGSGGAGAVTFHSAGTTTGDGALLPREASGSASAIEPAA